MLITDEIIKTIIFRTIDKDNSEYAVNENSELFRFVGLSCNYGRDYLTQQIYRIIVTGFIVMVKKDDKFYQLKLSKLMRETSEYTKLYNLTERELTEANCSIILDRALIYYELGTEEDEPF